MSHETGPRTKLLFITDRPKKKSRAIKLGDLVDGLSMTHLSSNCDREFFN